MKSCSIEEMNSVQGGTRCVGLWLGSDDGTYGVCIGAATK